MVTSFFYFIAYIAVLVAGGYAVTRGLLGVCQLDL